MKEPQFYNYFPLSEYQDRISRLRSAMRANAVDAVLMSNEPDILYFTGLVNSYWVCTMHDDTQMVLITADPADEPVLLLPENLLDAAKSSCVSDVRIWSQFSAGKSKGAIGTVADTFADLKLNRARMGMEIGPHNRPGMSPKFMSELKEALSRTEWVGSFAMIQQLQSIKSALEIEKLRYACKTTCQAIEVGFNAVREGMSEKELSQIVAAEMVKACPDVGVNNPWLMLVYASGRGECAFDTPPSEYRLRRGDAVQFDGGLAYHGYRTDMIRVAHVGNPSKNREKYYYATRDANMAALKQVRPGIKGKELYQTWVEAVRQMGFGQAIDKQLEADWDFLAHGLGVTTHELPVINSTCETVLQPGMVFSIEGNVFDEFPFAKTNYAFKNEENVLVTEDGYEWLTPLNNDLWIVE